MGRGSRCYKSASNGSICYILIQMAEPIETSELLAFTKAAEIKSLSRAAGQLGVPRATLGRRLARLEARLKVRLLRRTTRSLALTDAGQAFYKHARIVLDSVAQAEQSVRRDPAAVRGTLRVSVPPITDPDFHAMLVQFAARYPELQLHLDFTSRYVDLLRDGYDVALRAGSYLEPGLVARTLARTMLVAAASPAYLAAHGTPRNMRELRGQRWLLGFTRGELPQTHLPLLRGGQVHVEGSFFSSDMFMLKEAALGGLGIATLPLNFVAADFERGALVHVLPEVIGARSHIALVYLEREFLAPQVRAFIDAVVEWAPEGLGGELAAPRPLPRSKMRTARGKRRRAR